MQNQEVVMGAEVTASNKHENLDHAIKEIHDLQQHANDLLSRIVGNDRSEVAKDINEKQPQVTLQNILIEGPDRIRRTCNETHKILEEITQVLF